MVIKHSRYLILLALISLAAYTPARADSDSVLNLNSVEGMSIQITYQKGSDGDGPTRATTANDVFIKVDAPFLGSESQVTAVLITNCSDQVPTSADISLQSLIEQDGSTSFENGLASELLMNLSGSDDEAGKSCSYQLAIRMGDDQWQNDSVNKTHNFVLNF